MCITAGPWPPTKPPRRMLHSRAAHPCRSVPSICSYWHGYNEWYEADVLSVDNDLEADPERPDDIPEPGVLYVLLR